MKSKAFIIPMILGVILIVVGAVYPIPGGALTVRDILDGTKTDFYIFDDKYTAIDQYFEGDGALSINYMIGASLVSGKMSGSMAVKSICIVGGVICMSLGFVALTIAQCLKKEEPKVSTEAAEETEPQAEQIESTEE